MRRPRATAGWASTPTVSSYPTWLGQTLWTDLYNTFDGDVTRFCHKRIDAVPQGYSSFPDLPYERDDEPMPVASQEEDDPEGNAPLFIEWVYVLAPMVMTVFKSVVRDGFDKHGIQRYRWEFVTQVPLNGTEPDWQAIEDLGRELDWLAEDRMPFHSPSARAWPS